MHGAGNGSAHQIVASKLGTNSRHRLIKERPLHNHGLLQRDKPVRLDSGARLPARERGPLLD